MAKQSNNDFQRNRIVRTQALRREAAQLDKEYEYLQKLLKNRRVRPLIINIVTYKICYIIFQIGVGYGLGAVLRSASSLWVFFISLIAIFIGFILILLMSTRMKKTLEKDYYSSRDYIYFSISIFQIILLFALLYQAIFSISPESFIGITSDQNNIFFDFIYFSVVTFTTLGYGDIQPVSVLARCVVMIEVLLFVVYISIILLSMHRGRKDKTKNGGDNHAKK